MRRNILPVTPLDPNAIGKKVNRAKVGFIFQLFIPCSIHIGRNIKYFYLTGFII